MSQARITALYTYPVKSCAGISVNEICCDDFGLEHDRRWAITNPQGKVLTQRDSARMALIQTAVDRQGTLTMSVAEQAPLTVSPAAPGSAPAKLDVWGEESAGFDQGQPAADWLSKYLGMPCRLYAYDQSFLRQTKRTKPDGTKSRVAFADMCPLLVISDESLSDLNRRMTEPVPMNRFRPSIVISGLGEFAEDRYKQLDLGPIRLHAAKPCARCVMTTIDQDNGVPKGPEPLRTLNTFRRVDDHVMFGHYFLPDKSGQISLGMPIQVID